MKPRHRRFGGVLPLLAVLLAGCTPNLYNPARATRAYPNSLHRTETVDIQVFRINEEIEIVNSTAQSYRDFDLWLNQQYTAHVDALPAGATVRLSLWDFHDNLGFVFNAGGFWRTREPTPVRLVQIQPSGDEPMIGLITIRAEDVE